ncbi:uncharacterized protein PV06_01616 [Exophiala oligosperma]|uniref:Uncharacterized protein n=1 Tax=Exophiala oligosperma TaxID=215243 RepID=A0A0D2DTQ5_9EURO|nr:uncharacterized protein PV06_01616 [Exophiala oligosperma]KIW45910.1 hypothetical protein PV06_01616 [Exophiala oligosperma]
MAKASPSKTWLVTGASSGLGLSITLAALDAGHKVIACTRKPEAAKKEHPEVEAKGGQWLLLDPNSKDTSDIVRKAAYDVGGIDVVVNNAGYVLNGSVEDLSEDEMQAQMNTNFWGPVRVIKGVLPSMRARSGTIVAISSILGIFPLAAGVMYSCSKASLDMLQAVLAKELASFNVRMITINAGLYETNVATNGKFAANGVSDAYINSTVGKVLGVMQEYVQNEETAPGDAKKFGERLVDVVDGRGLGAGLEKNLRFLFGKDAITLSDVVMKQMAEDFEASKEIAQSTDFVNATHTGTAWMADLK